MFNVFVCFLEVDDFFVYSFILEEYGVFEDEFLENDLDEIE